MPSLAKTDRSEACHEIASGLTRAARRVANRGRVRSIAQALFAFSLLAAVVPARAADPAPDRLKAAAEEFDAGRRAFKAQDWVTAAEHFENAMHDAPSPEAMRLAIRARKNARQDDRAATLAAVAVVRYPDDKATVALSKHTLQQLRNTLHKIDVTCKPACNLVVDGHITPWGEVESAVVFLAQGSHTVSAGWSGERNISNTIAAKLLGASDMLFEAPPLPPPRDAAPTAPTAPPPPVATPKSGLPPVVFYSLAGATAVAGGITLWSGLDMVANPGKDQVRLDCAGKDESCPTYQEALSSQRRTNVLIGVTGGLAVGSAVVGLFFTRWGAQPAPRSGSSIVPIVGVHNGVSVGAAGRF